MAGRERARARERVRGVEWQGEGRRKGLMQTQLQVKATTFYSIHEVHSQNISLIPEGTTDKTPLSSSATCWSPHLVRCQWVHPSHFEESFQLLC